MTRMESVKTLNLSKADLEKALNEARNIIKQRAGSTEAIRAVKAIVASYRVADLAEPAIFIAGAVTAIEDFPSVVIDRLGSFKAGIVRKAKFMPTIAEMVAWCEEDESRLIENAYRMELELQARERRAIADAKEARWQAEIAERKRQAEESEKTA